MKYTIALLLFVFLVVAARVGAQNPPKKSQSEPPEEVVKVATNLVQVDAVVVDKNGRQVTNLGPEDFELIENGRVRQITGFSYISLDSEKPSPNPGIASRENVVSARNGPPTTLHAIRPESVRRAIAIVVDDFGLSFESIARLRSALEKFIQEHTQATDLIAIIRASDGPGAMQQFTFNRTQLLANIKRIRWYPTGRGSMSATESFSPIDNDERGVQLRGYRVNRIPDLSSKEFFGGSLGALGNVVQGLSGFPGRKSVVLISDNLSATSLEAQVSGATRGLDKLIAFANQHAIVISTIDARGLPKAGLTADDSQYNLAMNQVSTKVRERGMNFNVQQDGLSYLARQTGGVFIHGNNDVTDGLRQIIDGEHGYYLLAYRPDDADANTNPARGRTYKVTVRLKRPDLEVRTRRDFHRFTRRPDSPVKTEHDALREALASPFVKEDLRLKMTALFTGGSQVKILVHVDARDVEFLTSADGTSNASFRIAAVAFDARGMAVQDVARVQTLRVPADAYEQLVRDGFVYSFNLPLQNPGAYQLRVAVRDDGSGRIGSDSQFVDVPDPKKTRLALSGLAVQLSEPGASLQPGSEAPRTSPEQTAGDRARKGPGVRRFDAGDLLTYSYLIYGAHRNRATSGTKLTAQVRLFHADKEIFTSRATPIVVSQELISGAIIGWGTLKLGREARPGNYFLQVIVNDPSAPVERQFADQWLDFEVVK